VLTDAVMGQSSADRAACCVLAPVSNGAFTEWTAPLVPRYFSAVAGDAVYFSEQSAPVIARLAP